MEHSSSKPGAGRSASIAVGKAIKISAEPIATQTELQVEVLELAGCGKEDGKTISTQIEVEKRNKRLQTDPYIGLGRSERGINGHLKLLKKEMMDIVA